MKIMKHLFTLFSIILPSLVFSQLSVGDIAFLGMNADSPEGYSFITLTDIAGSDVIFFSDRGIISTASYIGADEGTYKFTAPPAGIPCGTIVSFDEDVADVYTITGVSGATMEQLTGIANFGTADQIYAYQTATDVISSIPSDATFIAGVMGDYDAGAIDPITKWTQSVFVSSTSESIVPPGLTNGINCVSVTPAGPEKDNLRYSGTLTGTSAALRALINNFENWETTDAGPYDINPSGYPTPSVTCIAPCDNPTVPTITYSPTVICDGETTTLTISGSLNDATAWHIYTGSCGGIEIGTTGGTTFVVTPDGPSTTYFVRGEGGCVTPVTCGSVVVTITPEDDATFSYDEAIYCPNGIDPAPTVTLADGGFSFDPAGLIIDEATGEIDLSESDLGTYTITYTTTGDCPSSSDQTVTIEDNDAPVPDVADLTAIEVECEVTELTNPGVTDNCTDPVIITNDASLPMTEQGTFTVTWTYDDGNGNTAEQTQTIIIEDVTGPTPDEPTLDDITVECEVTELINPSATDNCGGEVSITSDASLPITDQGTTTVTWTYLDINGNTTEQTQDVVINDVTAPAPDADPLDDVITACELNELDAPTGTDNCGGDITVTTDVEFPITEATTVTWTYDDGNGNAVTQTQDVVFAPIDLTVTTDLITITADNADADEYQWVDCNDGYSIIDGATSFSYEAIANGNYAVIITENECSDTSECSAITNVSILENSTLQFIIYPNPVSSDFVSIQTNEKIKTIELIDMSGRKVNITYNVLNNTINLTKVEVGNYIVKATTQNGDIIKTPIIILK